MRLLEIPMMNLSKLKIIIDRTSNRAVAGSDQVPAPADALQKVLLWPGPMDYIGLTYREMLDHVRKNLPASCADFHLKHYLPGYVSKLASDLEVALAQGDNVFLWSDEGTLLLFGHGVLIAEGHPWSDTERWFPSALDTLTRQNACPER